MRTLLERVAGKFSDTQRRRSGEGSGGKAAKAYAKKQADEKMTIPPTPVAQGGHQVCKIDSKRLRGALREPGTSQERSARRDWASGELGKPSQAQSRYYRASNLEPCAFKHNCLMCKFKYGCFK